MRHLANRWRNNKLLSSALCAIISLLIRSISKKPFNSVKIMQCEINKAKDYTFTLLAKLVVGSKQSTANKTNQYLNGILQILDIDATLYSNLCSSCSDAGTGANIFFVSFTLNQLLKLLTQVPFKVLIQQSFLQCQLKQGFLKIKNASLSIK